MSGMVMSRKERARVRKSYGCCDWCDWAMTPNSVVTFRRLLKRRDRQQWKKDLRNDS